MLKNNKVVPQVIHLIQPMKKTMMKKYGVESYFQLPHMKKASSERLLKNNPMFNIEIRNKVSNSMIKKIKYGNFYNTKRYKDTGLYYQGSYELDFLGLCESQGVLHKVRNGNTYHYENGINRLLTDFSIGDFEIEIKSSWIMKRQGGVGKVMEKRDAVEKAGKKYIFILDKDYSQFLGLNIIKKNLYVDGKYIK